MDRIAIHVYLFCLTRKTMATTEARLVQLIEKKTRRRRLMGSFDFPILICGDQFSKQLKAGTMTVLDFATLAKRVGVQGVEYRTRSWKDQARELPIVRDQVRETGLIATYGTFTTLFNRDAAEQQQLMQDLEDARAIGAQLTRILRGERPGKAPEDAHIWN